MQISREVSATGPPPAPREGRDRPRARRHRIIGLVVVLVVGLVAEYGVLRQTGASPTPSTYLVAALQVVAFAGLVVLLGGLALAHGRDVVRRGRTADQLTAAELRRARRRRLVWGSVDDVCLDLADADHLVVTRRGGLLAIDSAWRSSIDRASVAGLMDAAPLHIAAAEGIVRGADLSASVGEGRTVVRPLQARAIVVVWGPSQHDLAPSAVVDGVELVAGDHLVSWLRALDGLPVGRAAAEDLLVRLRRHAGAEVSAAPAPASAPVPLRGSAAS